GGQLDQEERFEGSRAGRCRRHRRRDGSGAGKRRRGGDPFQRRIRRHIRKATAQNRRAARSAPLMIRSVVGAIRTLAALLLWIITVPIAALFVFRWTFIAGNAKLLYPVGMGLAHLGVRVAGVRIKTVGLDKLDPAGTYIFMSNHVSNLDPPILCPI